LNLAHVKDVFVLLPTGFGRIQTKPLSEVQSAIKMLEISLLDATEQRHKTMEVQCFSSKKA